MTQEENVDWLLQRWSDCHRDGHDIAGIGTKQKEAKGNESPF
jgi:hypothetical protein